MPDFTIEGNPGGIRSRAATTRSKADVFMSTGDALAKITTDGWNSRAGDRFREKFDTEPERWRASGDGFVTAAAALENYADALDHAQSRARWAEKEYARGDQVSQDARSAYDADVSQAKDKVHAAAAAGQVMTLTIVPFHDPGDAIRSGALEEYASAKSDLESAAHSCAAGVRAGCAAAPEKRKWYESVGAAVGGFLKGAGEALVDLGELASWLVNPAGAMAMSLLGDAQSGMTAEEIAAKWKLKGEDAQGMLDALQKDPLEFGKNLGKAMLDWDTWSDDPARALGHLLPDAIIAVLTAGSGTVATRGAKGGVDALDALEGISRLDDLADLRHLDDLGDVTDLSRLDRVDLDGVPDWTHGRDVGPDSPGGDLYPDGYDRFGDLGEQGFFDKYWDPEKGSWDYPEAKDGYPDGFDGPVEPNRLDTGDVVDRYGRPGGEYASPEGTPFDQRALPPSSAGAGYHRYEVLKPLPEGVTEGKIAPWFEQPGGGIQYKFDHSIEWYIEHDYLAPLDGGTP